MGVERVINGVMLSGSATVSLLPATRQYSFAISGARKSSGSPTTTLRPAA